MNLTIKSSDPWYQMIREAPYDTDPPSFPIIEASFTLGGITVPFQLVSISEALASYHDLERDMEWCVNTEWKQLAPRP